MPLQGCQQSQIIILLQSTSCWCPSYCQFPKSHSIMFLSHETDRATSWLVQNSHVRGRDLQRSFLGKKSSFSQVTCKGLLRNSCGLLVHFMPNNVHHHGECLFFQWCHPVTKNKNKESSVPKHNTFTGIGSTAYYTLDSSWTLTHFMPVH
jgi:hypothetical protein